MNKARNRSVLLFGLKFSLIFTIKSNEKLLINESTDEIQRDRASFPQKISSIPAYIHLF